LRTHGTYFGHGAHHQSPAARRPPPAIHGPASGRGAARLREIADGHAAQLCAPRERGGFGDERGEQTRLASADAAQH